MYKTPININNKTVLTTILELGKGGTIN